MNNSPLRLDLSRLLLVFALAGGVAGALTLAGVAAWRGDAPSISLVPSCAETEPAAPDGIVAPLLRLTATFPADDDAATVHRYWLNAQGEPAYDLAQVRVLEDGQLELTLIFGVKAGQQFWGRLDWKGGAPEGITSGHLVSCP